MLNYSNGKYIIPVKTYTINTVIDDWWLFGVSAWLRSFPQPKPLPNTNHFPTPVGGDGDGDVGGDSDDDDDDEGEDVGDDDDDDMLGDVWWLKYFDSCN